MLDNYASEPSFLREQALIYQEPPEVSFSWLSIDEYFYEFASDFFDDFKDLNEHFVFEDALPYNIDSLSMQNDLKLLFQERDSTFSQKVLSIIHEQEKKEIEIYKRAHLDRKVFSKLRNYIAYQPSHNTAIALSFVLELDFSTAQDLLRRAGYALSHATISDLIIEYFLKNQIYSLALLNETLYSFGQPIIIY